MDGARRANGAGRIYEDFQPESGWIREPESDTFWVILPGFKKQFIKVQVDHLGRLKVRGERPLDKKRYARFYREVSIPETCNFEEIKATFEAEKLQVNMPKMIPRPEQTSPPKSPPRPPKKSEEASTETEHGKSSTPGSSSDGEEGASPAAKKKQMTEKSSEEDHAGKGAAKEEEAEKEKANSLKWQQETENSVDGKLEESPAGKSVDGPSRESMGDNSRPANESYRDGRWPEVGFDEFRQLVVNVGVAFLLVLVLLMYLTDQFISKAMK